MKSGQKLIAKLILRLIHQMTNSQNLLMQGSTNHVYSSVLLVILILQWDSS